MVQSAIEHMVFCTGAHSKILRKIYDTIDDPAVNEHVSLHFYENPDMYKLENLTAPSEINRPEIRLTVDTKEDFQFASNIYRKILEDNLFPTFKTIDAIQDINKFNIIIFAIKPQVAEKVIVKINSISNKNVLFISIMAGKKFSFFDKYFHSKQQIVRVMPNMPALVEKGMTCLVSNKLTSKKNKIIVSNLFKLVGKIFC